MINQKKNNKVHDRIKNEVKTKSKRLEKRMSWNAKEGSSGVVRDLRLTLTKARSCSPALWLRRLMLFMAQPVHALNGLRYGASVGTRGSMKVVVLVVWSMKNCYPSRTKKLRKLCEIFPSRKIWKIQQSSLDAHLSYVLRKNTLWYDWLIGKFCRQLLVY